MTTGHCRQGGRPGRVAVFRPDDVSQHGVPGNVVTAQLLSCRTLTDLQEVMTTYLPHFRAEHAPMALNLLPKLHTDGTSTKARTARIAGTLCAALCRNIQALTPRQLANSLWALGKLQLNPPNSLHAICEELLRSNAHKLRHCNSQEISLVTWALARVQPLWDMQAPPSQQPSLLSLNANTTTAASKQASSITSSAPAVAASLLGTTSRDTRSTAGSGGGAGTHALTEAGVLERMWGEVEAVLQQRAWKGDLECGDVARSAWAFARAGRGQRSLFAALVHCASGQLPQYKAQDVSNMVWALASRQYKHEEFLEACAHRAFELRSEFKGQELSSLIWSYATLDIYHPIVCSAVARVAVPNMQLFSPRMLVNIMWSFTTLRHYDEQLMESLQSAIDSRVRDLSSWDTANVLWSLAYMNVPAKPGLVEQLGERMLQTRHEWNAQDAVNTLYACALMQYDNENLLAAIRTFLQSCIRKDLNVGELRALYMADELLHQGSGGLRRVVKAVGHHQVLPEALFTRVTIKDSDGPDTGPWGREAMTVFSASGSERGREGTVTQSKASSLALESNLGGTAGKLDGSDVCRKELGGNEGVGDRVLIREDSQGVPGETARGASLSDDTSAAEVMLGMDERQVTSGSVEVSAVPGSDAGVGSLSTLLATVNEEEDDESMFDGADDEADDDSDEEVDIADMEQYGPLQDAVVLDLTHDPSGRGTNPDFVLDSSTGGFADPPIGIAMAPSSQLASQPLGLGSTAGSLSGIAAIMTPTAQSAVLQLLTASEGTDEPYSATSASRVSDGFTSASQSRASSTPPESHASSEASTSVCFIPPHLRAACRAAAASAHRALPSTLSHFQKQVVDVLLEMGLDPVEELRLGESMLSIDIALDLGVMKVAIECDGPSHYTRSRPCHRLGNTCARDMRLRNRGWTVVCLPFFEWDLLSTEEDRLLWMYNKFIECGVPL